MKGYINLLNFIMKTYLGKKQKRK